LLYLAVFVLGMLVMVNVHEIGHTVFARLLGDPQATYILSGSMPDGGTCFGCNFYDSNKLSSTGNLAVSAAGVLFTQVFAAVFLLLSRRKGWSAPLRNCIHILFFVFLFDLPFQVIQGLPADISAQTRLTWVDLRDFLYLLRWLSGLSPLALKAGLGAASALYLAGMLLAYRSI
jgi:hypothetical protein